MYTVLLKQDRAAKTMGEVEEGFLEERYLI